MVLSGPRPFASGLALDDLGRCIRAAVIDDQDLDVIGESCGSRCPLTSEVAAAMEVPEELVQRRPDPGGLVVGG